MCNCPDSPWVKKAVSFLSSSQNNRDGKWHTVNFLIQNNHCGITNRVSIESILQNLDSNGININRESFQQTILGELKRDGIVATLVYPGHSGGVFIPCTENEVKKVANQIFDRVNSEIGNLAGISQQASFSKLVSLFQQIISNAITWLKRNI
ncbi:MAG: hypothetical protein QME32_05135 [Endomicrobiia bacterium]|nr:hypothetical protein [Endomicrobiia bacterium]